jgi:predicted nuclease of predicted toxin-antitoxin system
LRDRLLIDECPSVSLVALAKGRGIAADHAGWLGKSGWQDRNLILFALENDYVVVTNNRRHFLKEYAGLGMHNGLIVIVPAAARGEQQQLFDKALDAVVALGDDLVNKLVEVLVNGTVHVREWIREDHDIAHVANPAWR